MEISRWREPPGNSPSLNQAPAGATESTAATADAAFHRPYRGGLSFDTYFRWLTPPANFYRSFQDWRNTKSVSIPC